MRRKQLDITARINWEAFYYLVKDELSKKNFEGTRADITAKAIEIVNEVLGTYVDNRFRGLFDIQTKILKKKKLIIKLKKGNELVSGWEVKCQVSAK
jgi:hypothetical protein